MQKNVRKTKRQAKNTQPASPKLAIPNSKMAPPQACPHQPSSLPSCRQSSWVASLRPWFYKCKLLHQNNILQINPSRDERVIIQLINWVLIILNTHWYSDHLASIYPHSSIPMPKLVFENRPPSEPLLRRLFNGIFILNFIQKLRDQLILFGFGRMHLRRSKHILKSC